MKSLIISILALLLISPLADAEQNSSPLDIIEVLHNKALSLKNKGRYEEAEAIFKQILTIEPTNPYANFDLGNVYLCQKRYYEAINHYKKAIRLGLNKKFISNYHFNSSLSYIGLGNNKEAMYHLEQCLQINPENTDAKNMLEFVKDAYERGEKLVINEKD